MCKLKLYFCLLIAIFFVSCSNNLSNESKHVILIGFDGLSSYSLNNGADMPTFRKLMEQGCYTLENRSVLPSSSAVNWASMFMGAGPELHGYTEWGSSTPDLPSRKLNKHGIFPDIYSEIKLKYPESELGFFYEWNGMKYLVDTLSINHVQQSMLSSLDSEKSMNDVLKYIKEKKPMFCSIIFNEPDGTGHTKGWESKDYYNKLRQLDDALNLIVSAVEEAGIKDKTIFILTADHGGINTVHGGKTMNEMQTPIVFSGYGIKKGYKINESTMVYDIAATIAYIFDVKQPQVWLARPIMSVFDDK